MGMEFIFLFCIFKIMEDCGFICWQEDFLDKCVVCIFFIDDGLKVCYIVCDVVFVFNNKVFVQVLDDELLVFMCVIGKFQYIIDEESDFLFI